ncbi:hypothetical protein [Streptomyces sp. VRA16 Mangrove soil]|uniref:hypothetical protein n=1 Tax=Streptomyces sp. VRA16 Mangrove soil TaxID=2817434 RepID=UPI001A9DB1BE|nr:hypothetical protein [Streptomyces sp. VRA16 Mangrove soil]MBO1336320.1 hypothetical protein [Streptomyces sp. VRA16 Mangrove soil]
MDLHVEPPTGVGPLRLGMTREESAPALESLRAPGFHSPRDRAGVWLHRPDGLGISLEHLAGRLAAVELWNPLGGADRVLYRGLDLFGTPAAAVRERLARTAALTPGDDGISYVAPDLLLALWRSNASDDPADPNHYFASVLVAAPGYYDGPGGPADR